MMGSEPSSEIVIFSFVAGFILTNSPRRIGRVGGEKKVAS